MERTKGFVAKLFNLKTLYQIKQGWFEKMGIDRFCGWLEENTFIRPNHITILNLLVGILALFLVFRAPLAFTLVMILHFGLDNLDGYYARVRRINTPVGKYIDHTVDFVLGVSFLVVSALYFNEPLIWILILLFCGEMMLIIGLGVAEEIFPSRIFLFFYMFGWYKAGLIAQAIVPPSEFVIFMIVRRLKRLRSRLN